MAILSNRRDYELINKDLSINYLVRHKKGHFHCVFRNCTIKFSARNILNYFIEPDILYSINKNVTNLTVKLLNRNLQLCFVIFYFSVNATGRRAGMLSFNPFIILR